jgi:hypothetical protein
MMMLAALTLGMNTMTDEIHKTFRLKQRIVEDLGIANKRKAKGETPFLDTKFHDPHIQKIVNFLVGYYNTHPDATVPEDVFGKMIRAMQNGAPPSIVETKHVAGQQITAKDFEDDINNELMALQGRETISPKLYSTAKKNMVESSLFGYVKAVKHAHIPSAPKFKYSVFKKLWDTVVLEHPSMFPLKNLGDSKVIRPDKVSLIITPSTANKKFNSIKTATATPNGEFIFHEPFCQELLNWGTLKGVQPKGKKYSNNGGQFPPEYAYIEFLIMHEIYHFMYGDFYFKNKYKLKMKLVNYAGDFRTNYDLVKAGYEQIPIGLFSDDLNLDRFKSYSELAAAVKAELDKFPPPPKNKSKGAQSDGEEEGGEGGEGEGENDDPFQPHDSHEHTEDKTADGDSKPADPSEIDAHNEATRDKIEKAEANRVDKEGTGQNAPERPKVKMTGARSSSRVDTGTAAFDWSQQRPAFSWKQIVDKCAKSEVEEEETIARPSRTIISRLHQARAFGSAAIKAGIVEDERNIKLAFIVDRSGSMGHVIDQITAEIHNVMKQHGGDTMYFVPFSNGAKMYQIAFKAGTGFEVDIKTQAKIGPQRTLHDILSNGEFGGTNFDQELVDLTNHLTGQGWNVILSTDSDILYGGNMTNFMKYAQIDHAFTILDSRDTWISVCSKTSAKPDSVTYFG